MSKQIDYNLHTTEELKNKLYSTIDVLNEFVKGTRRLVKEWEKNSCFDRIENNDSMIRNDIEKINEIQKAINLKK